MWFNYLTGVKYFTMIKVNSIFKGDLFLNKVAIVTGGATGIGASIAHELAHLGCNVVIASRKKENVDKASDLMNKNDDIKGKVLALPCNIRKREEVDSLIKETVKNFGKLDYLINNGGGQFMCPADSISPKGWHAVVETNLTGTFNCCQSAYNQYMKENGGVIVNIIADMWNGFPNMAHTGAARAGVDNITKTLALEWSQNGVRINSVAPGTIYSDTAAKNYPHDVFGEALKLQVVLINFNTKINKKNVFKIFLLKLDLDLLT